MMLNLKTRILTGWYSVVNVWRLVEWSLRLFWRSHRLATVGVLILTVAESVMPVIQLWVTKLLVDQVVLVLSLGQSGSATEMVALAWRYLGYEAGVLFASVMFGIVAAHVRNILQEHLVYRVQIDVLEQAARLDLAYYESAEYYDQMHRAQHQARFAPIQLLHINLNFFKTFITLLSICSVIILYKVWVFFILVGATLPGFLVAMYYGQKRFMLVNTRTPDGRRADYLHTIITTDTYAKEVRVWGNSNYFLDQIKALRRRFRSENIAISRKQSTGALVGELISTIGYYASYATVLAGVLAGRLTLGDMTLYAGAFGQAQSLFEEMMQAVAQMYEMFLFAEQLDIFLEYEPLVLAPTVPAALPTKPNGLVVDNVHFTYPGTEREILKGVNFSIAPGECVALVGANGAGKTTLVKCLLRLYDVDDGEIAVEGQNITSFTPSDWRSQIGVVFQDYARYQLPAFENIGLGDVSQIEDLSAIRQAAEQAGIDGMLTDLPLSYQTQLGRQFEDGQELSLGQWQRVAIARALLRDAPLLILDEPTAAMDPQAEYELYQQFRQMTQERMTLLISHRFSTVRMADRIIVLDDGKVIEDGSHEVLMAKGGHYAKLFSMQAESYQLSDDHAFHLLNGRMQSVGA